MAASVDSHSGARPAETARMDAVVVGAGFAGLHMLHELRRLGFSARGFELGSDVGGVWFWNRYPGARCDVESMQYSYSFSPELEQEWRWSERFAGQAEILRYLEHVADRFALRRDIRFETRVLSAHFDEATNLWEVATDRGDRITATYCIMASGSISTVREPDIPGIGSFAGRKYHTGAWPHEGVDFTGRRVGVIGTGSSGIQAIPHIARQAEHLTVFQRTPNFIIPARNGPIDETTERYWKDDYPAHRAKARLVGTFYQFAEKSALEATAEEREAEYNRRWQEGGVNFVHAYNDIYLNQDSNDTAADFVRARIREIVHDPETAAKLCPTDHPLGTKRICVGSDYFETFNRPNVTLVDVRATPIEAITPTGVRTSEAEYPLDALVTATGYDALTGALMRIDIRGRDGRSFKDKWAAGPRNYLGLMVEGFPNMFIVTGPGSPSVLVNMVIGIEQHVEWIAGCIAYLREHRFATIEPDRAAEDEWVRHVNEEADKTLFPRANSWYLGANIPGKPRVFLPYTGGIGRYRTKCDEVVANGYEGFRLDARTARGPGSEFRRTSVVP